MIKFLKSLFSKKVEATKDETVAVVKPEVQTVAPIDVSTASTVEEVKVVAKKPATKSKTAVKTATPKVSAAPKAPRKKASK